MSATPRTDMIVKIANTHPEMEKADLLEAHAAELETELSEAKAENTRLRAVMRTANMLCGSLKIRKDDPAPPMPVGLGGGAQ